MSRYHRQILLPQIGPDGQKKLAQSSALLIGCGALGSVIADQLARAGVGLLRIADRDIVELSNLQRQVLFDESDASEGLPKAVAAARHLARVNSEIRIEPLVVDVRAGNIEELVVVGDAGVAPTAQRGKFNLILDGTDNVETRYLINDVAVKHDLPWVYGACVGTEGRVMAICPPRTACLRCVFPTPAGAGELPTCDTAGVLGPAAAAVAALQAAAGIKILIGQLDSLKPQLLSLDLWEQKFTAVSLAQARRDDCPTCGLRNYEFLIDARTQQAASLCGRNAVQVRPAGGREIRLDMDLIERRLRAAGQVQRSTYFLRCRPHDSGEIDLTLFADGRAIVRGTADLARARSIYARCVGS